MSEVNQQTTEAVPQSPSTVSQQLRGLDKAPTVVLAALLKAAAFNTSLGNNVRVPVAVASKRLEFFADVELPADRSKAQLASLNPDAIRTIAHCLGLYEPDETTCQHFEGMEKIPTLADVEQLQRLFEAANGSYVLLNDAQAFAENEDKIELSLATPVLSDVPEDPQAEGAEVLTMDGPYLGSPLASNAAPSATEISAETFQRLFPGATPPRSAKVDLILGQIKRAAEDSGSTFEETIKGLTEAHSLMGEVIAAANTTR
jgi:hypothetical protein